MSKQHTKLTDAFAKTAPPGKHSDTTLARFILRVTPNGARSWAIRYRLDGTEHLMVIGPASAWPVADARKEAAELLREVDRGNDPLAAREARRDAPTVAELAERYYASDAFKLLRATSQADYRTIINTHLLPLIGDKKVLVVEPGDVKRVFYDLTEKGHKVRANRAHAVLRLLFNFAIKEKVLPPGSNPATGAVKKHREEARERYLTRDELPRLLKALDQYRGQYRDAVDIIDIALRTGARRGEIVKMRWSDIDLGEGVWVKPGSTTKTDRRHRVPLSPEVVEILRRRRDDVGPGKVVALHANAIVSNKVFEGDAVSRLDRAWPVIKAAAGLSNFHVHDLRHSYASLLQKVGFSLPQIGAMLGHTQAQTTKRYAHLFDEDARQGTASVSEIVNTAK